MIHRYDWPFWLKRLEEEIAALDLKEMYWLQDRVTAIGKFQLELDQLFRIAGGLKICANCDGACCSRGRHHLTLTNVLAYLLYEDLPPVPDFNRSCPYLGDSGCRLKVDGRPYNCITFFCDQLEGQLSQEQRVQLRTLDRSLRREYQAVAERYPVASLTGFWIAIDRIGNDKILSAKS